MTIKEAIKNRERCYNYLIGCGPNATPENVEAVKLSLEALKKRDPTMVTHEATLYSSCTCPSCKNVVDEYTEFAGTKIRVEAQWCRYCGQALKWEDDDD